ncbi:hypothetical protein [Oerskovia paurometabola]|uniref:Uncharacterized protein n=1 Tax=Oerskovia paurometabola TaxID=162170 RepID=A0ABW1X8Y5_9CELL|nr:hypothetical protein [Oerskovia paurometabola]MBM7497802.1 hypothetical protein [Oerskovia paurometabola]
MAPRTTAKSNTPTEAPATAPAHAGTTSEPQGTSGPPPETTTLDTDTTAPSTTAPGDGAADTTDPDERAQSTPTNPGEAAKAVGTVNAVTPAPKPATRTSTKKVKERVERYPATRPDGTVVTIEHNIDTGVTAVVDD